MQTKCNESGIKECEPKECVINFWEITFNSAT